MLRLSVLFVVVGACECDEIAEGGERGRDGQDGSDGSGVGRLLCLWFNTGEVDVHTGVSDVGLVPINDVVFACYRSSRSRFK